MNAERALTLVPYGSDPLDTLAQLLLDRHRRQLPDLSHHVALFPHPGAIPRFRARLLIAAEARGYDGVLAPWCGTLDGWLEQAQSDAVLLDDTERELLLLEALESYPALCERFGTWPLIDSLLSLFDELNAHHSLASTDAADLTALLAAGYRVDPALPPLRGEAELVHTLWEGWNNHLASHGVADRALHRLMGLVRLQGARANQPRHTYMVGGIELTPPQARWLKPMLLREEATLIMHGGSPGLENSTDAAIKRSLALIELPVPASTSVADPYTKFIDTVYAIEPDLAARARAFAATTPTSPLRQRLHVHAAADFEEEARAVDLAVRRWYAAGIRDIAIVTQDRKLARRVRALLERANLKLRDSAGWALSTTSAATAVMRWIECIEQDFAQAPFLDFLKSPFVTLGLERRELTAAIHDFESRIVRRHSVGSGLDRYRRAIRTADDKLAVGTAALLDMIDRVATAAEPLARLFGSQPRHPFDCLSALRASLEPTGLLGALSADTAGNQVLDALRPNRRSLGTRSSRFTWPEFRRWLERELERRRYRSLSSDEGIDLLGLAETRCRRFEAVVIAGCTRNSLPGMLASSPFFNDGVRRQLGLPTRPDRLAASLHDFRCLLEAAPRVLLTWRQTDGDEAMVASPWIERLVALHRLAYGVAPEDHELRGLLAARETALHLRDDAPLPSPTTAPAPRLPRARVPDILSASAHQRLLDCPYQFFVVDGLGLRLPDDMREEMEKSDYGRAVHRILHAFHTGVAGLPGPWRHEQINTGNRAQAVELLNELGRRVFDYDVDKRLSARGWRYLWAAFVETYVDWQAARAREWRVETTETTLERELTIGTRRLTLKGRVDRIDRGANGVSILDYKTGLVPDLAAVTAGEQTQLVFYALLHAEAIAEAAYAQLAPDRIKTNVRLHGDIARLTRLLETRLRELMRAIDDGAPLPAWGDHRTCGYCRFEGICRKEMWSEAGGERPS